jgi:hypothetical protein
MQPSLIRLAKIYKAFLFLLPLLFLPLEIEWFETPKQFLITLVAVITLPTLITNRHDLKEILEDNLTTLLFALFFVLTLTSLANGYFGYSLLGSPFRRDGLISIWSLFSVYLGFCILYVEPNSENILDNLTNAFGDDNDRLERLKDRSISDLL